jgi:hypothetical protein
LVIYIQSGFAGAGGGKFPVDAPHMAGGNI